MERSDVENALLDYLSRSPRTKQQLIRYSRRKGFNPALVDQILERFEEYGYIDDGSFAEAWVRSRINRKPMGRRRMTGEMIGYGLSKEVIERAYEICNPDEESLAWKAAEAVAGRYRLLEPEKGRRRLYAFLVRRGFDAQLSAKISKRIIFGDEAEEDY